MRINYITTLNSASADEDTVLKTAEKVFKAYEMVN